MRPCHGGGWRLRSLMFSGFIALVASGCPGPRNDYFWGGDFDRANLEVIVTLVRQQPMEPGRVYRFSVDNLSAPTTLRPEQDGYGEVWAEPGFVIARKVDAQSLQVVIKTGSGGKSIYGFAYSDQGWRFHPSGTGAAGYTDASGWHTIDAPSEVMMSVRPSWRIDERWTKVGGID